ncbi:MAG: hypothetical protein ACRD0L_15395 [Acidimicrobiales bacterium]
MRPPANSRSAVGRVLIALGAFGLVTGALRLLTGAGSPPEAGGWRELSGPDLR